MMNIAICDDNSFHLSHTSSMVKEFFIEAPIEIMEFHQAEQLINRTESNDYRPDIAILDIKMEEINGISLAKELNHRFPYCQIIFLTAFLDYAPDVYVTEHVYFVLKRDIQHKLPDALKKAVNKRNALTFSSPYLTVRQRYSATQIPISDVLYLERLGRKTRIAFQTGETWTTQSPEALLKTIPDGHFIRCHQSYWININKVLALKENEFCLIDNTHIPISRSFRPSAKKTYFEKLHKTILT